MVKEKPSGHITLMAFHKMSDAKILMRYSHSIVDGGLEEMS